MTNTHKIKILKNAIRSTEKKIDRLMLASPYNSTINKNILDYYEMIACWKKIIINLRLDNIRKILTQQY